jgi:imidazolonepropionase-like amidohydrolase
LSQEIGSGSAALALLGAKVYVSPTEPPILHATVLIKDGKILAVSDTHEKGKYYGVPTGAKSLSCEGMVITASFQNSHVHFTEPKWEGAAQKAAADLGRQLQDMFTQYGFTTVVDVGSFLANTVALRARVDSKEIPGPRILTAGAPLYPPDGTPFYLRDELPPEILRLLPEPATPEAAVKVVQSDISGGADVIKLFTGSLVGGGQVKPMPLDIATAAVAEAHRQNHLVFSHPSNIEGLTIALNAGVDVLAHTTPISKTWSDALIAQMKARHMSLTPTLKLWIYEAKKVGGSDEDAQKFADAGAGELGAYQRAGGQVLFGTDVGYMTEYDPTQEYLLMSRAGLTPMQILASLTTAPSERFKEADHRGRIAPGMDADLAVLDADPADNPANFAKVHYTIRGGHIIYTRHN